MKKGILVVNKYLVWPSAIAWAFWPFIFFKGREYINQRRLNHERIHLAQQAEMLLVPFYIAYGLNFLLNLFRLDPRPYHNISFEREAYGKEKDLTYLNNRPFWAWTKHFK